MIWLRPRLENEVGIRIQISTNNWQQNQLVYCVLQLEAKPSIYVMYLEWKMACGFYPW